MTTVRTTSAQKQRGRRKSMSAALLHAPITPKTVEYSYNSQGAIDFIQRYLAETDAEDSKVARTGNWYNDDGRLRSLSHYKVSEDVANKNWIDYEDLIQSVSAVPPGLAGQEPALVAPAAELPGYCQVSFRDTRAWSCSAEGTRRDGTQQGQITCC